MTSSEQTRLQRLAAAPIIQPVSRIMLPRDTVASVERYGAPGARFFVVVPFYRLLYAGLPMGAPDNVGIYPEGSDGYRTYCGKALDLPA